MEQGPRIAVLGLDCATPQLLFDQLADEVPTIAGLMRRGMHGSLESLTPPSAEQFTHPAELASEIEEELGGDPYIFDIPNFREQGEDAVLKQVFTMTERRWRVARRLVRSKPWDFFMLVEMGPDRLHHVFWQHVDPAHFKYVAGNRFESAFRDYYRFLDGEVAKLLEALPEDVVVIVMSDHGARRMDGGVCFNEWLAAQGYLRFVDPVDRPTPIGKAPVEWGRTVAWGDGGYYGRLFLNVKGREPQGTVDPSRYSETRDELAAALESMPGPDGEPLGTKVYRPQDVYPEVRGVAPDLIVYFGALRWRPVRQVGTGDIFTYENDTGPDGASHDRASAPGT